MIKFPLLYWTALFLLVPLWSLPHTIAGRYICEGILLIIILWSKPKFLEFLRQFKTLLIFMLYLVFQLIFFSTDFQVAFHNFRAEWMHFIIFSVIGIGSGLLIGKTLHRKFLLALACSFSIPLFIHVMLSIKKFSSDGSISWGYTGINEIHGDLGYTALQATILFTCYLLFQSKSWSEKMLISLASVACIASPLLAASRGGTGFSILGIAFTCFAYFLLAKKINPDNRIKKLWMAVFLIGLLMGTYKIAMFSNPDRWGGTLSRLTLGLEGDAKSIVCDGASSLENTLKNKGIEISPEITKNLAAINDGDGARVVVARIGSLLILEHPMGLNQSKEAYQQAVHALCQRDPKVLLSHSHNGWIDTALSLGIPGALLLLALFTRYIRFGYQSMRADNDSSIYGLALFSSACLWLLRGLLDSTQRDHMLEMQAFVLALLAGIIFIKSSKNKM